MIPASEYGGGIVKVCDTGTWESEVPDGCNGKKLNGSWVLVRTRGFASNARAKYPDGFALSTEVACRHKATPMK